MYYQQIIVIDIRLLCINNFEYFKSYQDDDQGWDQKKMSGFGRPEIIDQSGSGSATLEKHPG